MKQRVLYRNLAFLLFFLASAYSWYFMIETKSLNMTISSLESSTGGILRDIELLSRFLVSAFR